MRASPEFASLSHTPPTNSSKLRLREQIVLGGASIDIATCSVQECGTCQTLQAREPSIHRRSIFIAVFKSSSTGLLQTNVGQVYLQQRRRQTHQRFVSPLFRLSRIFARVARSTRDCDPSEIHGNYKSYCDCRIIYVYNNYNTIRYIQVRIL